jgi:hypothetical protein
LSETLPDVAWSQGFMGRMIIIFSPEEIDFDVDSLFKPAKDAKLDYYREDFKEYLKTLCDQCGVFRATPAAQAAIKEWKRENFEPKPDHPKLVDYCRRRMFQCLKLCMVSSISRGLSFMIEEGDFQRARGWLLAAEARMPEFFRSLSTKNDSALIADLRNFVLNEQKKSAEKTVRRSFLVSYLHSQVTAERVPRIIELAKDMGVIKVVGIDGVTAL